MAAAYPGGFAVAGPHPGYMGMQPQDPYMGMQPQDPYAGKPAGCSPLCIVVGVVVGVVVALGSVLAAVSVRNHLRPGMPGMAGIFQTQAGADIAALADTVGDANAEQRGQKGNPFRETVEDVFAGTRTSDGGDFGPVVLSARASALRAALEQRGFQKGTYYHGTNNLVVPLILDQGFKFSDRRFDYGHGIYVAETLEHAECYTGGDGSPIIELEVFFRPADKESFINFVPSNSEMDDVYIVRDPLAIYPVSVHECCEVEEYCM